MELFRMEAPPAELPVGATDRQHKEHERIVQALRQTEVLTRFLDTAEGTVDKETGFDTLMTDPCVTCFDGYGVGKYLVGIPDEIYLLNYMGEPACALLFHRPYGSAAFISGLRNPRYEGYAVKGAKQWPGMPAGVRITAAISMGEFNIGDQAFGPVARLLPVYVPRDEDVPRSMDAMERALRDWLFRHGYAHGRQDWTADTYKLAQKDWWKA